MSSQQKKKIGLNTVISWGASVVIIGLMFKILHWQGGEYMIAIGLLTESFLFFILGIASMTVVEDDATASGDGSKLHDLLATSITPKVIESLSNGFKQFTSTVASVNQVAGSFNTTQNLLKEMENTTTDIKKFRDNVGSVTGGFDQFSKSIMSIGQLAVTAQNLVKDISGSSQNLMKDFEAAGQGMRGFAKNVTEMNASFDQFSKTLVSINQMSIASAGMLKEFENATNGMKAYNKNLADITKVYQAQLDAFRKN